MIYVDFETSHEAQAAIALLHGLEIFGRPLDVRPAGLREHDGKLSTESAHAGNLDGWEEESYRKKILQNSTDLIGVPQRRFVGLKEVDTGSPAGEGQ